MNCTHVQRSLSALLDQEMAAVQLSATRRHLEGCAACGAAFESLRRTRDAVAAVVAPSQTPDDLARRATEAAFGARHEDSGFWNLLLPVARATAGVAVAATLIIWLVARGGDHAGLDAPLEDPVAAIVDESLATDMEQSLLGRAP